MDQPPAVAFTAFTDTWPRTIEAEIGAALCAIGVGKGFDLNGNYENIDRGLKTRNIKDVGGWVGGTRFVTMRYKGCLGDQIGRV